VLCKSFESCFKEGQKKLQKDTHTKTREIWKARPACDFSDLLNLFERDFGVSAENFGDKLNSPTEKVLTLYIPVFHPMSYFAIYQTFCWMNASSLQYFALFVGLVVEEPRELLAVFNSVVPQT
jgi:hypothetical protein